MSERRVERRLAAILAVDVAGYSRLMGVDEEGTLAALKAIRRELGDPPKIRGLTPAVGCVAAAVEYLKGSNGQPLASSDGQRTT